MPGFAREICTFLRVFFWILPLRENSSPPFA
jgi:hypothetical protein